MLENKILFCRTVSEEYGNIMVVNRKDLTEMTLGSKKNLNGIRIFRGVRESEEMGISVVGCKSISQSWNLQ